VQRRVTLGVGRVHVRAAVDEVADRVGAPFEGSAHERRPPVRVPPLDGRAAVGRAPDRSHLALARGGQDRLAEAQEVQDPAAVAFLGGDLECGLPGHVAHRGRAGHAVRQEETRHRLVAPPRRGVERGATVRAAPRVGPRARREERLHRVSPPRLRR